MSQDYHPINRIDGPIEVESPRFPKLPLLLTARAWLVQNWPHDHAWFIAMPTAGKIKGRTIWQLKAYTFEEGRPERFYFLEDLARLDQLESLVHALRFRFSLPRAQNIAGR